MNCESKYVFSPTTQCRKAGRYRYQGAIYCGTHFNALRLSETVDMEEVEEVEGFQHSKVSKLEHENKQLKKLVSSLQLQLKER